MMGSTAGSSFRPPPFLPSGRPTGRSTYDAVEKFIARNRLRRTDVWEAVLQAYASGDLPKRHLEGIIVPDGWSVDALLQNSIYGALAALTIEDFQTAHWAWIKCLMADTELDQFLGCILRKPTFSPPAGSRNTRARDAVVRAEVERYAAEEQKKGCPTSQKRAWDRVKKKLPDARYSQVIAAYSKLHPGRRAGRPTRNKTH
jgi:hypothetical protein